MSAGLRHWPPFRPKRAAETAAQGSTAASAANPFAAPKAPAQWLSRTKVLTDVDH
jgi:hypothetical protein